MQFCGGLEALVCAIYGPLGLRSNLEIRGRAGKDDCIEQAVEALDVVFCDSDLSGVWAQEGSCEHGLGDDQGGRRRGGCWSSCRSHMVCSGVEVEEAEAGLQRARAATSDAPIVGGPCLKLAPQA